jgi:hypothetical protein
VQGNPVVPDRKRFSFDFEVLQTIGNDYIVKLIRLQIIANRTRDKPTALKDRSKAWQRSRLERKYIAELPMSEVNGETFVLKIEKVNEVSELFLRNPITFRRRAICSRLLKNIIILLSIFQAHLSRYGLEKHNPYYVL